ncbi:MAG: substrate-binding domain-containing protein [Clostridia bacterium]|jgi:phosphate transport system substrate-binding protein|nr:substrate-binding domain-containing protein [Clostridia bacterium]
MNIKRIAALLLAFCLLTLCACGAQQGDTTTTEAPTESVTESTTSNLNGNFVFTKENYPRMGGSLANLPLGQAVTATVLGISREDANDLITFAGSTTDNYKAIVDGTFDILLAYEPSEEAKQYIADSGEELEMTPIGVDALVFICSKDNTVTNLTIDQIKSIYSGKTTDWSAVGGEKGEIAAYQRNPDSGSQTLFDKLIALGDDLMDPPEGRQVGTMIGLLEAIADYDNSKNALGYTVYYYLTNMEQDKLETAKILAVDGVDPSNETIGDGSYPLTNDFYVVIRKSAEENSPERVLYNWICSEQGAQLVKQENYPVRTAN